jgi:hypothetical protein
MLQRALVISSLFLATAGLLAQQMDKPASAGINLQPGTLPVDPSAFTAAVRDSYYHPDDLSALDCAVSIDWSAFFNALKLNVPADRLKAIQSVKIRVKGDRDKLPEFTFDWAGASLDTKQQVESSIQQMISGFYQMYWPMIASFPVKNPAEIKRIEPLANGGATAYIPSPNANLILTVDKDHLPIHYSFDSTAMKGTMNAEYTPSPNPMPGDLRRLTKSNVSEQIGTSAMNVNIDLDYQTIGGFNVPQHVTFGIPGAYSISMEFTSCSVSKEISVLPKTK